MENSNLERQAERAKDSVEEVIYELINEIEGLEESRNEFEQLYIEENNRADNLEIELNDLKNQLYVLKR